MDFQVLSVFVKQKQDKIITNKMGIHVEMFLKKALNPFATTYVYVRFEGLALTPDVRKNTFLSKKTKPNQKKRNFRNFYGRMKSKPVLKCSGLCRFKTGFLFILP